MINLFLRFQHLSFMSKAIAYWTAGDQIIAELNNEAEKLHQAIISGTYKPQTNSTLLARFDVINQHLTEQENQFSLTLANTARLANRATGPTPCRQSLITMIRAMAAVRLSQTMARRLKTRWKIDRSSGTGAASALPRRHSRRPAGRPPRLSAIRRRGAGRRRLGER